MFGLSFWEIAVILVVALLIFGPAKLPELARSLGRGLREFRSATDEFKHTIDAELHARETDPHKDLVTEKLPDTVARSAPAYGPVDLQKTSTKSAEDSADAHHDELAQVGDEKIVSEVSMAEEQAKRIADAGRAIGASEETSKSG